MCVAGVSPAHGTRRVRARAPGAGCSRTLRHRIVRTSFGRRPTGQSIHGAPASRPTTPYTSTARKPTRPPTTTTPAAGTGTPRESNRDRDLVRESDRRTALPPGRRSVGGPRRGRAARRGARARDEPRLKPDDATAKHSHSQRCLASSRARRHR